MTPLSQRSRTVAYAVKNDGFMGQTRVIAHAARRVSEQLEAQAFLQGCFGRDVTLVPMPRSHPIRAGFLWPAERICAALRAEGLCRDVLRCLERIRPVPPASMAATGQRPDPPDHDASIAVRAPRPAHHPAPITLVDDVMTRGSSFIGIVPHLYDAYPNATVHCFAVVRTISTGEVPEMLAPIQGTITSRAGRVRRQPSHLVDTMGR